MRRALFCIVAIGLAGCPVRGDFTPQIRVVPGAARRLDWLARSGPQATPASRVHVMKRDEPLGGPNAIGRAGDLMLENDEVVFVIDQLGSSGGFAESGGNVVDAADARVRKDELGQLLTYFGTFPRQGVYDTLTSGASPDGAAWVEAKGHELYEARLGVTTRYTLHAPDRALLIETTLENGGDATIELPSVGDAIEWGGAEKFAPGKARGFKGPSSGPYIGGLGRFDSYAITSTEGAIDGTSGGSWTDTSQRYAVKIAPREKARYSRVLLVGQRPDTSSLVGELALAAGQAVGEVEIAPTGGVLGTGEGVTLLVDASRETLTLAAPFVARLPIGRYWVAPMTARKAPGAVLGPIDVAADRPAHIDVPVDQRASVDVRCASAGTASIPCKLTFEGAGSTPNPDFGPSYAAGPARNQATTGGGVVHVLIAPGAYRITASRGPEYGLAAIEVDLPAGGSRVVSLTLKRVVDTSGYVACDFHQHTMLSADSPVATRDRLVANVAEGVEVAVASEHNVVADLEPLVRELQLDRELVSIAGDELTSDASRQPWGHVNVFPMPYDPDKARGGAPPVRDRAPRDLFAALRGALDAVVQVNHPRAGRTGYFDQLGFDRTTGVGTDSRYDPAFDALEVWSGRHVEGRAKVLDDFFVLLRTRHPVTPTADTDTHGIVGQEAGYPRTYVRVADDAHFESWDATRTTDLVRGVKTLRDVVLTNGPMLRVTANGVPVGGLTRGPAVDVKVHIESAPWVIVDEARLVRASAPDKPVIKQVHPTQRGDGLAADITFALRTASDDAFVVIVSGTRPMSPVLAADGDLAATVPWAMTGALWIDADGDGSALGR
jgi:hypothetical protein